MPLPPTPLLSLLFFAHWKKRHRWQSLSTSQFRSLVQHQWLCNVHNILVNPVQVASARFCSVHSFRPPASLARPSYLFALLPPVSLATCSTAFVIFPLSFRYAEALGGVGRLSSGIRDH
eukprot:gnl/TRDRNA2_/TRDRNA2_175468_c5_seq10.p1 gnl/TRDRNA2_/TRDRNA2_175468_c5~~gnl/TRDRNA2_/TRDRNA2_175468_c5_seq10.p1  ORF type:complete len:119 (+),score=0.55 gnl/TRDRNA2_/TRDRNA2_175468_c5_seq10:253-609(+)